MKGLTLNRFSKSVAKKVIRIFRSPYCTGSILAIIFFGVLQVAATELLLSSKYLASRFPIYKNIFYVSALVGISAGWVVSTRVKWRKLWLLNFMATCILLFLLVEFKSKSILYIKYVAACYFLLVAYEFYSRKLEILKNKTVLAVLTTSVAVATIFAPIYFGQHLNSESFLPVNAADDCNECVTNFTAAFEIDADEYKTVRDNNAILVGAGFYSTPRGYFIRENKNRNTYTVFGNIGTDLTVGCLFVQKNNVDDIKYCEDNLGLNSVLSLQQKNEYLNRLPFINDSFKYKINDGLLNYEVYHNVSPDQFYQQAMLIRGSTFHHYNSILQGLRGGVFDAFNNQYGFGPGFIVRAISKITGYSYFDSIYLSIFIVNSLVLLLLLYFFGFNSTILLGYAFSNFVVIEYSAIMAPFLYYIRVLPILLLVFFLVSKGSKNQHSYIPLFIAGLIGVYNKEYAVMAALASFVTYFVVNDRAYLKYSVAIICSLLSMFALANPPDLLGANFTALVLGVGFGGIFSLSFAAWIVFLISLIYSSKQINMLDKHAASSIFVLSLIILLSVKFITNPSPNHIGFLFLLGGIYVTTVPLRDKKIFTQLQFVYFAVSGFIIISGVTRINDQRFNFKADVQYTSPHFSNIFKMDKRLIENIDSGGILEYIDIGNVCVIAPNDDFLSIYFDKNITSSFPNFSTNINAPNDVRRALVASKQCSKLIVDKVYLSDAQERFVVSHMYNKSMGLNIVANGYFQNKNRMNQFVSKMIQNRKITGSTRSYSIYE